MRIRDFGQGGEKEPCLPVDKLFQRFCDKGRIELMRLRLKRLRIQLIVILSIDLYHNIPNLCAGSIAGITSSLSEDIA